MTSAESADDPMNEPLYSERYVSALSIAAEQHRCQTKKGPLNTPYIAHLIAVSAMVWEDGGDEDQATAALLHDVLEDTPTQPAELRWRFGEQVAAIVELCTDANPGEGEAKAPWRARKEEHFRHLRRTGDVAGLRVVCADKVHNIEAQLADAKAAGESPERQAAFWSLFKGGFAGTLWYYRNVREAIGDRLDDSRLVQRLDSRISELAKLWKPDGAEQVEFRTRVLHILRTRNPAGVKKKRAKRGYYELDANELTRRLASAGVLGPGSRKPRARTAETVVGEFVELVYGGWPGKQGRSTMQAIVDTAVAL